ncbi:MAG: O-antigen ligase family protein [Desulfomonilaceae bacterium]
MDQTLAINKNFKLFLIISFSALAGGYFYVMALGTGFRAFIIIHGGILFFAGIALFLRNIKEFLIFSTLFAIALGYGRHFVYERLPFESVLYSAGIRLDGSELILILCYIHWAITSSGSHDLTRRLTIGGKVGAVFLAWMTYVFLSSFLTATREDYSLYEALVYFKGFLLFFYLVNNIRDNYYLKLVVYALFAACVAQSLYMILQYITKTAYTINGDWIPFIGPEGFRSRGFYGSPDAHATFLVTIFPMFVLALFLLRDLFRKTIILTAIVIILAAIICSKVRIAFASIGIGVATAVLISYTRGWLSKNQIAGTIIGGALGVLIIIPFVYARFAYGIYGEDRWPLIVTAYNMFKSHLLFGVGANNYNFVVMKYIPPSMTTAWVFTVHDEYLLRIAETGFVGFCFYYYLIWTVTKEFYRGMATRNNLLFLVSCGLFSALIASLFHRLVSMYHYQQVYLLHCTIYALAFIVNSIRKEEASGSE